MPPADPGATEPGGKESRQDETVGLAAGLAVLWVAPSVLLCAAYGYFSLLSVAFFSLALEGDRPLPTWTVVPVVIVPLLLLVVMVVLGRLASRLVAACLARRASLARVPVWALALVATLGGAAAAGAVPLTLIAVLADR